MLSIWTNILRGSFLDLKSDPRISEKGWKIEETSNILNLISEYLGIKLHGMSDKMTDSGKTWGKERGFCFVINGNIFFHFSRSFAGKTTYFKKWHPLILKWRFFFSIKQMKKIFTCSPWENFFWKIGLSFRIWHACMTRFTKMILLSSVLINHFTTLVIFEEKDFLQKSVLLRSTNWGRKEKNRKPLHLITSPHFAAVSTYLIFVIFFTRAKFLENKIYT